MQGCLLTHFYPGKCCSRARRHCWLISRCPAELSLLHAKCFLQEKTEKLKHMSQLLILGVTLHFAQTCWCSFCAAVNWNTDEKPLCYSHILQKATFQECVSSRPQPLEENGTFKKMNVHDNEGNVWMTVDPKNIYINTYTLLSHSTNECSLCCFRLGSFPVPPCFQANICMCYAH